MEQQFLRNQMLWGQEGQHRLAESHVILFGLGGVGSYTAECLARAGVGELTIVDNDTVGLTNLNRQLEALHSTIGQNKTDAVAARLRDRRRQPETGRYALGDLTLETASHRVTAGGREISLTRTEYAILKLLMQNHGQVLAKSVLLERISLDTPDCTESSLKTHISHLRGKLREAAGKEYVESVWGIGFRIVG